MTRLYQKFILVPKLNFRGQLKGLNINKINQDGIYFL
jgi:hypothetical protein